MYICILYMYVYIYVYVYVYISVCENVLSLHCLVVFDILLMIIFFTFFIVMITNFISHLIDKKQIFINLALFT